MLITKPLPEEFSAGHLGRLIRINGMPPNRADAYRSLHAAASPHGELKSESPLHAMAQLLEMDVATYARRHTLLPFHSFAFRSDNAGYHTQWRQAHYRRFGFSAINPHAVFCPACVAEDEMFWGFSYWRREHQILGVRRCARHEEALMYTTEGNAYFSTPAEWIVYAQHYMIRDQLDATGDILRRYQETAALMLEQGAPSSLSRMRDHIARQAQAKGLVLSECATGNRLTSDRIILLFPPEWLKEVFPRAENKQLGRFCNVFDNALKPVRSGTVGAPAMACALVALFDDPEIAISTTCSDQAPKATWSDEPRPVSGHTASGKTDHESFRRVAPPAPFSSRHLARTYLSCQGNPAAIATSLGCNEKEVHRLFAKGRKNIVTALRKAPEARALKTFLAGESLVDASRIHDVPVPTLEALLRYLHNQLGVPATTRVTTAATHIASQSTASSKRGKQVGRAKKTSTA